MPDYHDEMTGVAEAQLNCMEIWGGNQATESYLPRPGLDLWVWSRSQGLAEMGGSDLHYVSSCASGRITRMFLADVCGCGSMFQDIANELRELMKRNVNAIKQSRFIRDMSTQLEAASARGGFASTMTSTYFAPTRTLALCNAGHPPPLLYRAQGNAWSILKQSLLPTGGSEASLGVVGQDQYQQFKTKLERGDMVLSYSNSWTECRNQRGRTLGLDGLLDRVRQLDAARPAELVADLAAQVQHEHDDNLVQDDATLLLCQATDRAVAWRENLLAPLRLLGSVSDKTKLR